MTQSIDIIKPSAHEKDNKGDIESGATTTRQEKRISENAETELSSSRIVEEIGGFGLYQILVGLSTGIALALTSFTTLNFIFAASIPDHRCWIPECEAFQPDSFNAEWTKYAIPNLDNVPDACSRHQYISLPGSSESNEETCNDRNFNQSLVMQCDAHFIKNQEDRLASRLNMLCTGQEYKLTLIGTAGTVGKTAGMLFVGIISDKLGRLNALVSCSVVTAVFSCLQSLPAPFMSFELYMVLEFLVTFTASGILGTCYVFNMEWTTAKHRIYLNCLASFTNALHPIGLGFAAWYLEDNFVAFKMVMGAPGFFLVLFYLYLREPPQWLLARRNYSRAIKSIKHAGKINGHPPSTKFLEQIQSQSIDSTDKLNNLPNDNQSGRITMLSIVKEKILAMRLVVLSIVWFCTMFAYYGILLSSTNVHENKYTSYMLIGIAEVPGAVIGIFTLDRFGRRLTIGVSLLVYGSMLILASQLPAHQQIARLILFFLSRTALKTSFLGMSTFTTEMWPTTVRTTAFNICALFGRMGGIIATLTVLLATYYAVLPVLLYGSSTILAAILLFAFLPETKYLKKLPDSIEETINIGRNIKE